MYDTGACLLAAIRALPDDDAPRLALADWLEENGAPNWADLIRVQIEMHDHGGQARPDLAPGGKPPWRPVPPGCGPSFPPSPA